MIDKREDLYFIILSQEINFEAKDGSHAIKEFKNIIATFPKEYSVPFTMYIAGLNYEEIANSLNINIGIVKSRIFCMRKKLHTLLKDCR